MPASTPSTTASPIPAPMPTAESGPTALPTRRRQAPAEPVDVCFHLHPSGTKTQSARHPARRGGGPAARWSGGPVARWPGGPVARWPGGPVARCIALCPPTGAKARRSSIKNAGLFCLSSSTVLSVLSIPAPAAFRRVEGVSEMFRGEGFYEGNWCTGRRCLLPHRRVPSCRDRASCPR